MCRLLSYVGSPVLLDHLLYAPDSSLLDQTIQARMLHLLNLAGFGMAAWDPASHEPAAPFRYRTTQVALFDRNLKALASKIRVAGLLAHIRGVPYHPFVQINEQNCHPFRFEGVPLAMAHNGDLAEFRAMRFDLAPFLAPRFARAIGGSTDSEWIHALTVSALPDPYRFAEPEEILAAIRRTLAILSEVRARHGITRASALNLIFCDGFNLVATRHTLDAGGERSGQLATSAGSLSMWYSTGRDYGLHGSQWGLDTEGSADSVIVASEPLTRELGGWREVPEASALVVRNLAGGTRAVEIHSLAE